MIATFEPEGTIKPFRFRLSDEYGESQIFNIRHINYSEKFERENKVKFAVKVTVNGQDKTLIVWFYGDSNKWYIDI